MRLSATALCTFLAVSVVGCSGLRLFEGLDDPKPGTTEFESASPTTQSSSANMADKGTDEVAAEAPSDASNGNGGAARAIEEADIVKVNGNTLYALSEYRGLVVIDLTDKTALKVLGQKQLYGSPFEMYFRDNVAYLLYSSYWEYVYNELTLESSWQTTSRIVALDVSNNADIKEIGAFDLPGQIGDTRIVGDVLYAVSFENGYCYNCATTPKTTVTSLQVGQPQDIKVIQQMSYDETNNGYSYRRSITVTPNRMYVSGLSWSGSQPSGSTIQVIDISNPDGTMREGAKVTVNGQIASRWQMDEYAGTLRVISQPWQWWGAQQSPTVQTFKVNAYDNVQTLGSLALTLPQNEQLQSVRFDGERAYAVTYERKDPLFVLDLSDPAEPKQRGELQMPGWLYHMEPRGDRMLAVGFDDSTGSNKMAISLFDVSDLDNPTMLSRVIFGGDWGWMPEDQDRIHKAFNIMADIGLILMPYSGWTRTSDYYGQWVSGVQLVDWSGDTLTLRGVAPHKGSARRGFVHDGKLLAMSDDRVDAFDISDRGAPQKLDTVLLSRTVHRTATFGAYSAQLTSDWWDLSARLDIVPKDNPNTFTPIASLDLTSLSPTSERSYYFWTYGFGFTDAQLFVNDSLLYLVWGEQPWCGFCGLSMCSDEGSKTRVVVIDVSNPAAPTIRGKLDLPMSFPQRSYWNGWGTLTVGEGMVQVGSTLVMQNQSPYWYGRSGTTQQTPKLEVVDLSAPDTPLLASEFSIPGGDVLLRLQASGSQVLTSHFEPIAGTDRVRYYADRIEVSNPFAPTILPKVNIPGSLAWYDRDSQRLIAIDYQLLRTWQPTYEGCGGSYVWYDYDARSCVTLKRTLNSLRLTGNKATLVNRIELDDGWSQNAAFTPSRIFIAKSWGYPDPRAELVVMENDDSLSVASRTKLSTTNANLVAARGNHALVSTYGPTALRVFDATDAVTPSVGESHPLFGWSWSYETLDDGVMTSNGPYGAQFVPVQ